METRKYIVTAEEAGARLDIFLVRKGDKVSRSWVQKLIKDGHALVNGKKAVPKTPLNTGDSVTWEFLEQAQISIAAEEISPEPNVIFENTDFILLEKPAGIVVHPSASTPGGTLVNWLLLKYPSIKEVGEEQLRPGIVHRLDKDTSGLLVVCKTQDSYKFFKKSFKERNISKTYQALVKGKMDGEEGTITFPIARDRKNPFKRRTLNSPYPIPKEAREAETFWHVARSFSTHTLLEVVPKTGRMHQIRVHLAAIGHPIAGDTLYNGPILEDMPRIFLHATSLSFNGPDGKEYFFSSPLPADLTHVLSKLED